MCAGGLALVVQTRDQITVEQHYTVSNAAFAASTRRVLCTDKSKSKLASSHRFILETSNSLLETSMEALRADCNKLLQDIRKQQHAQKEAQKSLNAAFYRMWELRKAQYDGLRLGIAADIFGYAKTVITARAGQQLQP